MVKTFFRPKPLRVTFPTRLQSHAWLHCRKQASTVVHEQRLHLTCNLIITSVWIFHFFLFAFCRALERDAVTLTESEMCWRPRKKVQSPPPHIKDPPQLVKLDAKKKKNSVGNKVFFYSIILFQLLFVNF